MKKTSKFISEKRSKLLSSLEFEMCKKLKIWPQILKVSGKKDVSNIENRRIRFFYQK